MKQKVILIYDDEVGEVIAKGIESRSPYSCLPYTSARRLMDELGGFISIYS